VVDRAFGIERPAEERAAAPFAGGIARKGSQCGMIWGSALAGGAEAHRLGASPEHATMAAGFAGGIGLCGGACGALGAAVWVGSMGAGRDYKALDANAAPTIARFLAATDGRFECAEIVGRKFESVADHAAFVRDGGCTRVVEALASR
jgi:hypothetical protein